MGHGKGINYANGKIYKIVNSENNKQYIGSTTKQYLSQRFTKHNESYKSYLKGKYHYVSSFDILEHIGSKIELIESFPCQTKDELLAREGYWIKKLECVNKCIAGRDGKQYYIDNKETIDKRNKEYNDKHKDEIKMYDHNYYQQNKSKWKPTIYDPVKGKHYRSVNSGADKEYRKANKDRINLQQKRRYKMKLIMKWSKEMGV